MTTLRHNPEEDAPMHMFTEAAAVFVIAPVTAYIAYANPQLPTWQKVFLYGTAAVTLAVDGYLLAQWVKQSKQSKYRTA